MLRSGRVQFIILFLIIIFTEPSSYILQFSLNVNKVVLNKFWLGLHYRGPRAEFLNDGIPDGWEIIRWGGAMGISKLEKDSYGRGQIVKLERNSDQGVIALVQNLDVKPNSQIVFSVYSRGSEAAIQFRYFSVNDQEWIARGWQEIPYGVNWNEYKLSSDAPSDADRVRILLRVHGTSWFDDAFLGFVVDGEPGSNVLKNAGFEHDGVTQDPFVWWRLHFISDTRSQHLHNLVSNRLSHLNIIDFLSGRYDNIWQRSDQLGENCAPFPEMTSWLTALVEDDRSNSSATVREYLFRLAMDLAPNCPQPYAALANLYEGSGGHWRATELYRQAAELSRGTELEGKYYFQEGFLHVRYTGDFESAVRALEHAENIGGWEQGAWYKGSASFYLGVSYEALGRYEQARGAYQRVLECEGCTYHHEAAKSRLKAIRGSRN